VIAGEPLNRGDDLPRKLAGLEDAVTSMFADMLTTPGGSAWWAEAQTRGRFMGGTYTTVNDHLARHMARKG
jgi:hypothetical protein